MKLFILLSCVSAATVYLLTPVVRRIAFRIGALDQPGGRKIHAAITPRLGGLAIFLGISVGSGLYALYLRTFDTPIPPLFWLILIGSFVATVIGVLDDIWGLGSKKKLVFQLILGAFAYRYGFRVESISVGMAYRVYLGAWALPITMFWVAGVMNAVNLIDGIDGLASGTSAISFAVIALIAHRFDYGLITSLSLVAAASCLAFLRYNFSSRKIFMGDSGSMMLGFMLAVHSMSPSLQSNLVSIYVPLFCLAFPIVDTTVAILRRSMRIVEQGWDPFREELVSGKKRFALMIKEILTADGDHIHHRLITQGLSKKKTLLVLYAFSFLTAGFGYFLIFLPPEFAWLLCLVGVYAISQQVLSLDYAEFSPRSVRRAAREFEWSQSVGSPGILVRKVKSSQTGTSSKSTKA